MQNVIDIPFPDAWAVLPTGSDSTAMIESLSARMGDLGEDAQQHTGAYLAGLSDFLGAVGIDLFASLVVPSPEPNQTALAWCAVGVADAPSGTPEALQALAADDPFGGLDDPELGVIEGRTGPIGRCLHFRANPHLSDADGYWPYSATVRYAVRLGEGLAVICHFETMSLGYLDVLAEHFDTLVVELRVE